jgi:uncharacterized protein YjiS (DUF1127 family)
MTSHDVDDVGITRPEHELSPFRALLPVTDVEKREFFANIRNIQRERLAKLRQDRLQGTSVFDFNERSAGEPHVRTTMTIDTTVVEYRSITMMMKTR